MDSPEKIRRRAQAALRERLAGADAKGYVRSPEKNLIDGVQLNWFEDDLRRGAGNELQMKFCAAHSSAALVMNTFAPFKVKPNEITLLDYDKFHAISFEKELDTGLRGTKPHLDVWFEGVKSVIGVESKLLEYFVPKEAKYTKSYKRNILKNAEDCWWQALEDSKLAGKRYLDVAQLVKHYLGMINYVAIAGIESATLLYLFWEPTNNDEIEICREHRRQADELKEQVKKSTIRFEWFTYNQLWDQWADIPRLMQHAENLKLRYEVSL